MACIYLHIVSHAEQFSVTCNFYEKGYFLMKKLDYLYKHFVKINLLIIAFTQTKQFVLYHSND